MFEAVSPPRPFSNTRGGRVGFLQTRPKPRPGKKGPKECIPEEQELEGREEGDEEDDFPDANMDNGELEFAAAEDCEPWGDQQADANSPEDNTTDRLKLNGQPTSSTASSPKDNISTCGNTSQAQPRPDINTTQKGPRIDKQEEAVANGQKPAHSVPQEVPPNTTSVPALGVPASSTSSGRKDGATGQDHDDEDGMQHLEQEAEKMVALLQDTSLDEDNLEGKNKASALPLSHEAAMKWFYKDPQGEIQGPFTNQEMAEWFQAGYFTMSLLVKRGCDEGFQALGEVIKMWGRVPFVPGPVPPPFLSDPDQERMKRQRELAMIQMQLQYQQYLQAQIYTRHCSQIAQLQQKAALGQLTPQQQQHLAILLQQGPSLKQRAQEQQGLLPQVSRSMSTPDPGSSLWDKQSAAWDGTSIWDLPSDSPSQTSSLDHLQQLEREKVVKLEQDRREVELRLQREEDDRKRQEDLLQQRQEEERKRREEEDLTRRKQEETLRRQREQEEEEQMRRQKQQQQQQQQQQQKQEEMLRRQEEKRRREEEERRREDMLRKQQEDETRRLQEEEEARRHREDEECNRKEIEMQRQKEMIRQRQQQQEALRRLQQQQQQQRLVQMKLPASSTWGQQLGTLAREAQASLSLAEIQKLEEEHDKQIREEHTSLSLGTASASVWGNLSPGANAANPWSSDMGGVWSNAHDKKPSPNIGFWDEAVKELGPPVRNMGMKTSKSSPTLGCSSRESYGIPSRQSKKKTDEEDKLLKLFQGVNKAQDGFTQWCEQMLHALNTSNNLDVSTFVSFLKEVESPYEVHDYITAYLGETPDAKEFAKQFLERRAKQKQNQQRQQQQQQQQDSALWGMAQGSLPSAYGGHNTAHQASFEAMQASKKKKKQRMVRADPSILGFSVNASSDRLNMGEIETLDD
uniref:GYF domain-containing protein n=1 Tax=Eptatretus burgeri TaxID=7764 RepID=A0A8C4R464_EPTBU